MNIFKEEFLNDIVNSILTVILMWIAYSLITGAIKKVFKVGSRIGNEQKTITIMKLVNSIIKYVMIVFGFLIILGQFGFDTKGLIASLGVVGVVAGLALKDIVADLISGFSIITDDQYDVGDYITIGDFTGEVIELGLQTTKIKGFTGDVKIISNGTITEVINHSKNSNGIFMEIITSYKNKIETVEKALQQVCDEINETVDYVTSDMKVLGIERLTENAIVYKLYAEVEPMKGYEFRRIVNKTIKKHFDKNKIEIPCNQLVIYNE